MAFDDDLGAIASVDYTVDGPSQPSVTARVIDNTVTLSWTDVTTAFSISYFEIRSGATWEAGVVVGQKQGSFTTVTEYSEGEYTYWVAGVDLSGTYGPPNSVTVEVGAPPDFTSQFNQNSTFSGTKVNALLEDGGLLVNVNLTETWATHFTSRSWTTIQDQINAGYAYYALPSTTTSSYEETIDYGSIISGSKITATLTHTHVVGNTTITPTISVKAAIGDAWTNYANTNSVYAVNFRYIKILYDFTSTGNNDLLLATGLNIRSDAKLITDSGSVSAVSTDAGGTLVSFNKPFARVTSIHLTVNGTTGRFAVCNFTDVANPTSFRVLVFSSATARQSASVYWQARGV
jgi:hypothetical protein